MVSNFYKGNKNVTNLVYALIEDNHGSGDECSSVEGMRFLYDIIEGYFGLENGKSKNWCSWKRREFSLVILDKKLKQLRILVPHDDVQNFIDVLSMMNYSFGVDVSNKYGTRFKIKLPDIFQFDDLSNFDFIVKNCFNSFNQSAK